MRKWSFKPMNKYLPSPFWRNFFLQQWTKIGELKEKYMNFKILDKWFIVINIYIQLIDNFNQLTQKSSTLKFKIQNVFFYHKTNTPLFTLNIKHYFNSCKHGGTH